MVAIIRDLSTGEITAKQCDLVNSNNNGFITLYFRDKVSPHAFKYWREDLSHEKYSFIRSFNI